MLKNQSIVEKNRLRAETIDNAKKLISQVSVNSKQRRTQDSTRLPAGRRPVVEQQMRAQRSHNNRNYPRQTPSNTVSFVGLPYSNPRPVPMQAPISFPVRDTQINQQHSTQQKSSVSRRVRPNAESSIKRFLDNRESSEHQDEGSNQQAAQSTVTKGYATRISK